MANTIYTAFRTFDAENFIDSYQQHIVDSVTQAPENYLYLAIAKQTDWGTDGSGGEELNPEAPNDTVDQELRFWADIIALQRVQPNQISPVIPRDDWSNAVKYVPYDDTLPLFSQGSYYTMNSNFQVFLCTEAHATNFPSVPPTWNTGDAISYVGSDGYGWEYVYTIAASDIANMVSQQSTWIPIPLYYDDGALGNGKEYPMRYIQTRNVMVRLDITETSMPITNDDSSVVTYRQIGLINNPRAVSDGVTQLTATSLSPNDIVKITTDNIRSIDSKLIYLENRTQVTRQAGQVETPKIVLEF